ncbi:MAG: extracellular solute-binding protein [Elusimicrobiota bacterium]
MCAKKNKINFWVTPNAGFDTDKIIKEEISRFQKKQPAIEVKFRIIPWSHMWQSLMDVFKGAHTKSPPDVIQIGNTWVSSLVYMKALRKLNPLIKTPCQYKFVPQLWESCKYGPSGNIYALPWFSDIRILYYRKDVLKKLGRNLDSIDSWPGFEETLGEVKRDNKIKLHPMLLSGQKESVLIHDLLPWMLSAGGKLLFYENGSLKLLDRRAKEGARFYFDLITKGYIVLKSKISPVYTDFFTGNYAFQISGVWPSRSKFNPENPDYKKSVAENFGVSLLPKGPSGRYTYIGGSGLAVTKLSQNPEAAFKFIDFLVSSNSQVRIASAFGMLPAKIEDIDIFFSENQIDVKNVYKQSIKIGKSLPSTLALGTLEQLFTEHTSIILNKIKNNEFSHRSLYREFKYLEKKTDMILNYIAGAG